MGYREVGFRTLKEFEPITVLFIETFLKFSWPANSDPFPLTKVEQICYSRYRDIMLAVKLLFDLLVCNPFAAIQTTTVLYFLCTHIRG